MSKKNLNFNMLNIPMAKKKTYRTNKESPTVKESEVSYEKKRIRFFNSFEEQEQYKSEEMAKLSPEEILKQMRQLINLAYGMHGYDPNNLPKKHTIRIISK